MNSLAPGRSNKPYSFGHLLSAGIIVMASSVLGNLTPIPLLLSPCAAAPSPFPKPPRRPAGWLVFLGNHLGLGGVTEGDLANLNSNCHQSYTQLCSLIAIANNIAASQGSTNTISVGVPQGIKPGGTFTATIYIWDGINNLLASEDVGVVIYDVPPKQ